MNAKTCKLRKGAGNLRAKNYGHTSHDATCDAHVHLYLLRTHTTPLGVCRVAGVRVAREAGTCKFLQDSSDPGNPQIYTGSGGPSAKRCPTSTAKRRHRLRARDADSDNDSTGNDTP